jgi:hypothetical protein
VSASDPKRTFFCRSFAFAVSSLGNEKGVEMLRVGLGLLCVFVVSFTSARAEGNDARLVTDIATWSAGAVTPGAPVLLRGAFDSPLSVCGGTPCFARGGVAGVEVRRKGSSVYVGVPEQGKLATMFGWIPATRWHQVVSSPQPARGWNGVWQNETAKVIVQSMDDGQLDIKGHAVRDLGLGTGEIFGDFEVTGKPENGIVAGGGDASGCKVAVRLLGSYLVVDDNGACGGMGVSFSGMYRLRHH